MNYLYRAIAIISKAIILAFMFAVILVAALSSVIRYYTPLIENYKEPILAQVNSVSDAFHVSAEVIAGEWQPLQPVLVLENVEVKITGQDEIISLEKLRLGLDLFLSLYYRTLYFEEVKASNLSLVLKQSQAGLWGLKRTAEKASEPASSDSLKNTILRLWRINNLVLDQLDITLEPFGFDKVKLPIAQVELLGSEKHKYIHASISDEGKLLGKVIVDAQGEPFSDSFDVRAYVEFLQVDVLKYLPFVGEQYGLYAAKPEGKLWLTFLDNQLDLDGAVSISDFHFRKSNRDYQLEQITTKYAASINANGSRLWLQDVSLKLKGDTFELGLWQVGRNEDAVTVFTPNMSLPELSNLLALLPLPDKIQDLRKTLSASGQFKNLLLTAKADNLPDVYIQAEADNIATKPYQHVPGLEGVSGKVFSSLQSGYIDIDSQQFKLFFPNLFDRAMPFDSVSGKVSWDIVSKHLYLNGERLSFSSKEVAQAYGDFSLQVSLVKGEGEPGKLSLAIAAEESKAKFRSLFIPKNLSENLLAWLDKNILSGDILKASYIYHGPLKKGGVEPRINQLWLDVDNASISYLDKWPVVDNIKGEFILDGVDSFARVDKASISNIPVRAANISISPEKSGQKLVVQGEARTTTKRALGFLKTEGLSDLLQGHVQPWQSDKGGTDINAKIIVPINQQGEKLSVDIDAEIKGASIYSDEFNLRFTDIFTRLHFDLKGGLSSDAVRLRFLQQPVTASIKSSVKKSKHATRVDFSSKAKVSAISDWMEQPFMKFVEGSADFTGSVNILPDESYFNVTSNLLGVDVLLPEPLLKTVADERAFSVHFPLASGEKIATVDYGKAVKSKLRFSSEGLDAVVLDFGIKKTDFEKNKVVVSGQLVKADVEEWLSVVSKYQEFDQALISGQSNVRDRSESRWGIALKNITVNKLQAFDYPFENARVSLFDAVAYWHLSFEHSELKGNLKIFNEDSKPFIANLHYLDLHALTKKEEEGTKQGKAGFNDLPDVDFTISQLEYQGENYGEWEFQLRASGDEIKLQNITGDVKHLLIGPVAANAAELSWREGEEPQARFFAKIRTENIAEALSSFGYSQEVHSEYAEFDVNVFWQGGPSDFAIDKFVGTTSISLEKGNFADAESGTTEALKFLSAINLAEIVRRLKLDFSDLTREGLAFDDVQGLLVLDQGVLEFKRPLRVNGASSKISIQGRVDLNQDNLDLDMGVTLPFASNLPWIAALAAGLPAAAGVYVISKVLKKQVNKLSSAIYKVSGSIEDPNVEFVRVFDSN